MPFKNFLSSVLACVLVTWGATVVAADVRAEVKSDAKDPRVELLKRLPAGAKIDDLRPAPIPGLFEFSRGAEVSYLTADGKFFIDGSVYDMDTHVNLTEERRNMARLKLLSTLPESQLIVFSPKAPQYTVTVFTDPDCGYCRKLHSEINELNKLGVRVRYAAFPRSGPGTDSWRKAQAVWCAEDRNAAMTRAKQGAAMETGKLCRNDPVAREFQLGQELGVRGTPAMITDNGEYISGYLPPADLVRYLKDLKLARR